MDTTEGKSCSRFFPYPTFKPSLPSRGPCIISARQLLIRFPIYRYPAQSYQQIPPNYSALQQNYQQPYGGNWQQAQQQQAFGGRSQYQPQQSQQSIGGGAGGYRGGAQGAQQQGQQQAYGQQQAQQQPQQTQQQQYGAASSKDLDRGFF